MKKALYYHVSTNESPFAVKRLIGAKELQQAIAETRGRTIGGGSIVGLYLLNADVDTATFTKWLFQNDPHSESRL